MIIAAAPCNARPGARRPITGRGCPRTKSSISSSPTGSRMAIRSNDQGGLTGDRLDDRLRSDAQGLLPRRRPQGPDQAPRLHPGPGRDRGLARAGFQEQGGARAARARKARAITAIGSPISRRSIRISAPTPTSRRLVDAAHAPRHESLHGHHRQPHRRRHPDSPNARCRTTVPIEASPIIRISAAAAWPAPPINTGFAGERDGSAANFAKLTDPNYAYTVTVPPAEKGHEAPGLAQRPDLLPQPRRTRPSAANRATIGDFVGLDDLFTENPRVISGMIEIYGSWIDRFGVDGFRIDTAQHVNPDFWQAFVPAMLERAPERAASPISTSSAKSRPARWTQRTPR